jgi:DNA-binding NarL/FixJ family response regulator
MVTPRILTTEERSRLTPRQVEVLQYIAAGKANTEAAHALNIAVGTLNRCLIEIGYRLQQSTNAAKVGAALSTGQMPCPSAPAHIPELDSDELALLRALARFSERDRIAAHAGVAVADLRPSVDALISKAGAANAVHLVALAYAWALPGFHTPSPAATVTSSRAATR